MPAAAGKSLYFNVLPHAGCELHPKRVVQGRLLQPGHEFVLPVSDQQQCCSNPQAIPTAMPAILRTTNNAVGNLTDVGSAYIRGRRAWRRAHLTWVATVNQWNEDLNGPSLPGACEVALLVTPRSYMLSQRFVPPPPRRTRMPPLDSAWPWSPSPAASCSRRVRLLLFGLLARGQRSTLAELRSRTRTLPHIENPYVNVPGANTSGAKQAPKKRPGGSSQ